MNDKAKVLNMSKTRYVNSHGLANTNNRSTAYDIALLSSYAMQHPLFR
jgi:serine-type D-Ala-D-Ala carboxypeptidase (penicillin-binding protein 5/6)